MAGQYDIREDMQVLGSDGGMIGRVDGSDGSRIKLKRAAESSGAHHHYLPLSWIARVDDHVHLDRPAAQAREQWTVGDDAGAAAGAAHAGAHDRKGANWIPWLIGVALLAVILFLGVRGCSYAAREPNYTDSAAGELTPGERGAAGVAEAAAPGALDADVRAYLASTEAMPRTFTFQNLEFDSASAAIRPENRQEIDALAIVLKERPQSRVRIIGYADALGAEPANQDLGLERAKAVAAALVALDIAAARIDTASGGEARPEATNATEAGRQDNRRTELVVLSR